LTLLDAGLLGLGLFRRRASFWGPTTAGRQLAALVAIKRGRPPRVASAAAVSTCYRGRRDQPPVVPHRQGRRALRCTRSYGRSRPLHHPHLEPWLCRLAEWGEVFGDPPVGATALLDRLLHHAVIVQIEGSSYRLRQHTEARPLPSQNSSGVGDSCDDALTEGDPRPICAMSSIERIALTLPSMAASCCRGTAPISSR